MPTTDTNLPPNVEPLLPSQARTAFDHYLESNLDTLTGITQRIADELFCYANEQELIVRDDPFGNPVLISDLLRMRTDQSLALHPKVCQLVADEHLDALLDDIVRTYHDHGQLDPPRVYPEPVLGALNANYQCAYQHPWFTLVGPRYGVGDEGSLRGPHKYPIQVHDVLADLRADGIVTNLGQSDCEYCGLEAGNELAERLTDDGQSVDGYVGIDATSQPTKPVVVVRSYEPETLSGADLVLQTYSYARRLRIRSDLTVRKAGELPALSSQHA